MGLVLKDGGDFTLAPAGQHQAVCVDVIDKGLVAVEWNGQKKTQHKCRIVWEIDEAKEDGTQFTTSRQFTATLNERGSLRPFLEAWRGQPFTAEELAGFDTEQLIGANAVIQVTHAKKGDRTYDNVTAIMRLVKGMEKITPSGKYVRVKDRTPEQQTADNQEPPPLDDNDLPF